MAACIGIRVSTASERGGGHIARCLAVRRHLTAAVHWFVDPGPVPSALAATGDALTVEDTPAACDHLAGALASGAAGTALVDSYAVAPATLAGLERLRPIAVLCDAPPYPAVTLVIDPQPTAAAGVGGPAYLAVADRLQPYRAGARASVQGAAVLIAFGAVDSADCTAVALAAIAGHPVLAGALDVTVALGGQAPHLAEVRRRVAELPRARLVVDAADMGALYNSADMAIGAPGVSQAERMYCGLPTLLLAQNDAQRPLARAWANLGAALTTEPEAIFVASAIETLYGDFALRLRLRETGLRLVDGRGAPRIADAVTNLLANETIQ